MKNLVLLTVLSFTFVTTASAEAPLGYYRFPALHGDTVVFTAEGDLWTVSASGGIARRLTSHLGAETHAAVSPDGDTVAFSARYEGGTEVWVMPISGGQPQRLTWDSERAQVVGWTRAGEVLFSTGHDTTLPTRRLVAITADGRQRRTIPLEWATEGAFDELKTLYFTRFESQWSEWRGYEGGRARSLWRFAKDDSEASPLTTDHNGTDQNPMWWQGRLYFASDRDGTLNLWSMASDGSDLQQLTDHDGWDVRWPDLQDGRIVYQIGADLRLFNLSTGDDELIDIRLASDLDQRRERFVEDPLAYLSSAHISPEGDRVVLTVRGKVVVAPTGPGRWVEAGREPSVRYRDARFLPSEGGIVAFSDASGEVELWRLDPRGIAAPEKLTDDGSNLRFDPLPSPDGRLVLYAEKDNELWLADLENGRQTLIDSSIYFGFGRMAWSPDSRWLAYSVPGSNHFRRIRLYEVKSGDHVEATSSRWNSDDPAFSPDGRYLYFRSDRHLKSVVTAPWAHYSPQPFLDKQARLFLLTLSQEDDSPFRTPTELDEDSASEQESDDKPPEDGQTPTTVIDREGLIERIYELPVKPGRYKHLEVGEQYVYWQSQDRADNPQADLVCLEIKHDPDSPTTVASDIKKWELSADRTKILIVSGKTISVTDANGSPLNDAAKAAIAIGGWTLTVDPVEEWRQMFTDAWRLHRDYFYDPAMHGLEWTAMLTKYRPLVDRVTDRAELSDLFAQMVGELAASHQYVRGGDHRQGHDQVEPASLGATFERDDERGGWRVERLYRGDPDLPEEQPPLHRARVREGDIIRRINGRETLAVIDPGILLRGLNDRQVLLEIADQEDNIREVVVEPFSAGDERRLRYRVWELERRQMVDQWSSDRIGYVHVQQMGGSNYSEWARHVFPVIDRPGLVVDMRNNTGGNIDSWILGYLLRRPWMWWTQRQGAPYSNMQDAFGGHLVVLCNEHSWSDGELFCEGFRRLGLGPVIGSRTGGGEIWLTSSNRLVDGGIASAPEFGVFGPDGQWLVEGHGVEPDISVDNLPHATFNGEDAQLKRAVNVLLAKIADSPPKTPQEPEARVIHH